MYSQVFLSNIINSYTVGSFQELLTLIYTQLYTFNDIFLFNYDNDTHKLLWDFDIQTDHRRPDLIIINKKKKKENQQNCRLCCPG